VKASTFWLAVVMVGLLGVTAWGLWDGWRRIDVEIPLTGWIALAGGVVLSVALGAGLMALSFYSSRSGHDDRVRQPDRE
jgi:ABC-type amino acid transport system permease subunit